MELIMFVGIPASGKSSFGKMFRQQGYQLLSSDEIRAELTGDTELESLQEEERTSIHSRVFSTISRKTREALSKGKSVVVDATNLSRKRRMSFLSQFGRFDCVKRCFLFITPVDICLERNRNRSGSARVPDSGMERMLRSFECPNYWEGWDEIVPVINEKPYSFPFEEAMAFDQDNPHHCLTLGGHMEAAARFCREQGCSESVIRAAAYHDVGKLFTRQYRNSRGEPTDHATYLGHDNYGAYLYLTEMCCGKDPSPEEFRRILHETCLVNCHMRPMFLWKRESSTEEKDRQLFGEAFIADLMAVHQADRAAH